MEKLFSLTLFLAYLLNSASAAQNLTSPIVTNWGEWGQFQRCPAGTKVIAFSVKTDPWNIIDTFFDDTCMNGVKFYCGHPGQSAILGEITSAEGQWGKWGGIYRCNGNGYAIGFMLKSVEANTANVDETATNNLRMICADSPDGFIEMDGEKWGEWTNPRICDSNEYICGLQTQIEGSQGITKDDTSLNNIRVECCDL